MMRGRLFEEFEPGEAFETAGRTITEADVVMFAGLSGDYTELHTNEEFARGTQFGRRIAHGALVFSVSIGLTTRTNLLDGTIVAFSRVDNLRFTRPVFIGDTIHVSKRLLAAEVKTPDTGMLAFDTRVVNQHGQTVLAFVDRLLVRRRAAAVAETTTRAIEAAVSAG
jgi:acyl dehydratase